MKLKKVNKDPFSNGHEYDVFELYNCQHCIKSSEPRDNGTRYTNADENNMPKCSIQRDIVTRMFCNDPIKQETIDICNNFTLLGIRCPFMKSRRRKYTKQDKNQTKMKL